MNKQIMKANLETGRILRDHHRYINTLNQRVHLDTYKAHSKQKEKTKKEARQRKCLKKKMETDLKYKIESHEKMVRDQIANYVRRM